MQIVENFQETEDTKKKSFALFMDSVMDAFQFNVDPTSPDRLEILSLKTGKIWDLENFKTKVSSFGIDLQRNM